jgi:hypothetical protein
MIESVTIELSTDNDTEHDRVTLTDNDVISSEQLACRAVHHYKVYI